MQLSKSKMASLIAMFLMLTMAVTLVAVPLANAHDPPWTVTTYAFIEVSPNPVGVGQTAYVNFWLDKVPPTAIGYWGMVWHNMEVKVTKPQGGTDMLGPFSSDAVGGAWTQYTPDETGTYTFEFTFPGQTVVLENEYPYAQIPGYGGFLSLGYDYINDTYTASSATTTLTVQEDPVETAYPDLPLPTTYWTRPINSMNREWYSIGGNWLGLGVTSFGASGMYSNTGNFNPYTTAPNSAHVIWTEPLAFGGQIGGEFGPDETSLYATGTAYEAKFSAVVLYGILYYTEYPGAGNNPTGLKAVDLRTGETVWEKPITTPLRCGMIYNFQTGDQYGGHAYLFCAPATIGFIPYPLTNDWEMYDAMTGEWILNIDNASAGTLVRGPNGELLSYTVAGGMLNLWNASKCIAAGAKKNLAYVTYSSNEIWRPPQGATIDWSPGIEWSAPVATDINGKTISPGLAISLISDDVVLMTAQPDLFTGAPPGGAQTGWQVQAGYSAVDGQKLWGPINRTLTPWTNVVLRGTAGEGVYCQRSLQTKTWTGYDIKTGTKLWGPTQPSNSSWAYYDWTAPGVIGYGNLYSWGLSGEVYAYDAQTGDEVWSWYAGNAGIDSPFGTWPLGTWNTHHVLADGKLYVRAGHDYTPPVFKGAKLYCLNATTGEEIWSSLSFDIVGSPVCADGYMVWFNGYDDQLYCYGKGLSSTSVSTSPKISANGDTVLIEGMVTDLSPGAMQKAESGEFPNGVPAIADEYMSAWMEYLYQQQPMPQDATGVTVKLETLDPNGNYYDIGTVTSDASGMYKLMWEPPVPGEYTIIATFAGSESYWSSYAETAIGVTEASPTPAPEEPLTLPPTDMYVIGATIAIIIAIGIATVVIIKRK